MNNLFYLLRVQLLGIFRINKLLHTTNPKEKRKALWTGVGMGLLSLFILAMSFLYNGIIAISFRSIDLLELYLPMVMSLTSFIILMTTLYKVNGVLFEGKDYDMLLALPVKTSHIVASRVLMLYMMSFLFLCIIMIPAGIVYAVVAAPSIAFYLIYMITLFFIPLIPIIFATFVGAIITMITARFKHTNLISMILNFILMVGVIYLSFGAGSVSEMSLGAMGEVLMNSINKIYPLASLYLQAVCNYSLGATILFIGLSLIAFSLFALLIGKKFKNIHTMLHTSFSSNKYQVGEMKVSSALGALYYKELKRYFGSSLYVMNTSVGIIFMLMIAGSLFFLDTAQLEQILGIPNVGEYIAEFAPLVAAFCIVLNCTTACSISLEGKNLWILQSCPIDAKTIFLSKIGVQLTLNVPAIVLNGILMMIALKPSLIQSILIWVIPLIYTTFMAVIGININLKWPNLEWTNEVVVIKQSMAMVLAMMVGLLSIVIPGGLMLIIPNMGTVVKTIGVAIVMSILTYMAYHYMSTKGEKLFRDL